MAQHASAAKQARKALKNRARNRAYISRMKTAIKKIRGATEKEEAQKAFRRATKLLDQLAAKGIIHSNKAANQKSRLAKVVNRMK